MTNDMTRGGILKKLLIFAGTLLLASLVQQLYNTVDILVAGRRIGKLASSAIGMSGILVTCIVGFFGGISVGTGVVIGQCFGAGDRQTLKRAVHNGAALALAGGVALMAVGWLLAPVYIGLMRAPEEIYSPALSYLRIYFLSMPAIVMYNIGAGILRALGDSRSPLMVQIAGGLSNVVMDVLFVSVLGMEVKGIAWATLISQSVAALFVIYRLTRLDEEYRLRPSEISLDRPLTARVLKLGIPAGTQAMAVTLSNAFVQYRINTLGVDAIAAFTGYYRVELLLYLPIMAFGQAIMTFSSQNWGAKQYGRVKQGVRRLLITAAIITAASSAAALRFGTELFGFFNRDPAVIATGMRIIRVTFPFYFVYNILQILGDSLRGTGRTSAPMVIVLTNICLLRSAILFTYSAHTGTVESVAAVYPITWICTALCMTAHYLYVRKKNADLIDPDRPQSPLRGRSDGC